MLSRAFAVASCLSLAALLSAGSSAALELPLPPEGDDIVGQIQVIKAKYEDTFADLGTAYDLGYTEMVAANPGVDPWLPGAGTEIVLPTRFILPPGPREGIVINLAEYRMYYFPKGRNVVYTYPLGIGREGWGSPITNTAITGKTPDGEPIKGDYKFTDEFPMADGLEENAEFVPYVEMSDYEPKGQFAPLDRNLDWGAYYFWKSGKLDEDHARRCPKTVAALSDHAPILTELELP